VQRDFERAGDFEKIDVVAGIAVFFDCLEKGRLALIDDIAMPASLNERNARTASARSLYCL
jgi:hypothetical protein